MGLTAWNIYISATNTITFTIFNLYNTPIVWQIVDTVTGWTRSETLAASSRYGGAAPNPILAHGGDQFVVSFNTA
jgi:hypothetical protein